MFTVEENPNSLVSEAYKSLRTAIKYFSTDEEIKTIVVTSALPSEGKTTIAGNLAITLSESGAAVLLVDCDLRNPSIHRNFNISNDIGLTSLLIEESTLKETTKFIRPNLVFISTGEIPPNPSEILGSKSMSKFIDEMKKTVDYIIFDTPPVLPVTDAKILAQSCDATILVTRANKSKEKSVVEAYEELKKIGVNVIGTILNDSEERSKNKRYGYYGVESKKKGIFNKKKYKRV